MKKTTFIYFTYMGLVPIGIISVNNLNPLNTVVLLILLLHVRYAIQMGFGENRPLAIPSKVVLLVVATVFASYVNMVVSRGKISDWTIFYSLSYLLFWVIIREVRSYEEIERLFGRIGYFCLFAILWLVFFYFYPQILSGPFKDIRMGSIRDPLNGMVRVFTPGMEYLAYALMFIPSALFLSKGEKKVPLLVLFVAALLTLIIVTSVRTYLVGLLVALFVVVLLRLNRETVKRLLIVSVVLFAGFFLLPEGVQKYALERIVPIANITQLDVKGALEEDVAYGTEDEEAMGTLYWRILEIPYAMSLVSGTNEVLFGAVGRLYSFRGVEDTPAPHVSIVGIYYLFGLAGVCSFLLFVGYFSVAVVRLNLKYRSHPKQYLAAFALIAWMNTLLFSFGGGVFYSTTTAILAGLCALIVLLERLLPAEGGDLREISAT